MQHESSAMHGFSKRGSSTSSSSLSFGNPNEHGEMFTNYKLMKYSHGNFLVWRGEIEQPPIPSHHIGFWMLTVYSSSTVDIGNHDRPRNENMTNN